MTVGRKFMRTLRKSTVTSSWTLLSACPDTISFCASLKHPIYEINKRTVFGMFAYLMET